MDLSKSFSEVVGRQLMQETGWQARIDRAARMYSFGSANGTFADVVGVTQGCAIDSLSFNTLIWGYGVLVQDQTTPKEAISLILPVMTEALLTKLRDAPLEEQHTGDLAVFSSCYFKEQSSGRFDEKESAQIGQVVTKMVANFLAKHQAAEPKTAPAQNIKR